jgi:hypothetical protein
MSPQGFGFESRRGERRSGKDRRSFARRFGERRERVVPVVVERRLTLERRFADRRVSIGPRRALRDRRSFSFRGARGLRLTTDVKFYLPPDFLEHQ